ncbi:hypothetical protein Pfo_004397 [Paulownia fortunei]|nr:hypothetical protein Pfo_004397 [Paulownia fortunei]
MSLIPLFRNNPRNHVCDPFAMDIWDPFGDFNHECINYMSAPHFPFHNNISCTRAEWQETPEEHVLRAELPGLQKEEVKVKVEEGKVLKISGKREVEKEEKHENGHHFERSQGQFLRAFSLPENCRPDRIRSSFENGVLTVTVPKRDVKKSRFKTIEVKG